MQHTLGPHDENFKPRARVRYRSSVWYVVLLDKGIERDGVTGASAVAVEVVLVKLKPKVARVSAQVKSETEPLLTYMACKPKYPE